MKQMLLALTCVLMLSGCIAYHGGYEVVIDDKARSEGQVKFENYKARDTFYKKVDERPRKAFESKDEAMVIGLFYTKDVTFYQTSFINEQIRSADINCDGVITLEEAEKY